MHDKHQEFFDKLAAEWDLMYTAEDLERLSNIISKIDIKEGMDIKLISKLTELSEEKIEELKKEIAH